VPVLHEPPGQSGLAPQRAPVLVPPTHRPQSVSVRQGACGFAVPLHCGRQIVDAGSVPFERLSSHDEIAFNLAFE